MKKRRLIPSLLCALMLTATAEVHYLPTKGGAVPAGKVDAVEARVALPGGRVGSDRPAQWKICWKGGEAALLFDFRTHLDGIDDPAVEVECNGHKAIARKGFNVSGGWNTLAVEWDDSGRATVMGGEFGLQPLLTLDSLPRPTDSIAIKGDKARIEMLIVETDDADFGRLESGYSQEALDRAERWRYLDRENDEAIARNGGDYELAMLSNGDGGYDLVYMSGGVTNASSWHAGMMKGRMMPTGYTGYFKLRWIDATGHELADECFVELDEANGAMTLNFPALQAKLRFAKKSAWSGSR